MEETKVGKILQKQMKLYSFQGIEHFKIPYSFSPKLFLSALDFEPDPSDLFVASYPKCGTTWARMITSLIFNNGQPPEIGSLTITNFLEYFAGKETLDKQPAPRLIKTHLTFDLVPYNKETKYVYVARNPFDCCVSFHKHTTGFHRYEYHGDFDEYFELFMHGEVVSGEYFRNVLSWYEHKDDPNILFILFEDMKENPLKLIKQIGEFMGGVYAEKVQDEEFVKTVLKFSDFKYMQEEYSRENKRRGGDQPRFPFFRKGVVGDHKNVFSEEQKKRLTDKCEEKLKDTTLLDSWRKYGIL